jgi:hypothetical protein
VLNCFRELRYQFSTDVNSVQDFDLGDLARYQVEQHHPFACIEVHAIMLGTIAFFRLGLCVERRASRFSC